MTAASCYNFQILHLCACTLEDKRLMVISPCVSCYIFRCVCVCMHVCGCVSPGPAHISVAQTGAADGHAETCSVLHRDIFGLLCYCEKTGCWRKFLYKTHFFFFQVFEAGLST